MAQFQIVTPDEPTMFAAAQGLGFLDPTLAYAQGLVGTLTGGVLADGVTAWAANLYGAQDGQTGFYGILALPDAYALPGDTQTLASRVLVETFDPVSMTTTITSNPFSYGPVVITAIPADSPVQFS